MRNKVFVTEDFKFDLQGFANLGLSTDSDGNYLIANKNDLQSLADFVSGCGDISGKTFKLTGNISAGVDFHIGTADSKFAGTLDGNGYKVTVSYGTAANPNTVEDCALFNLKAREFPPPL